MRIEHSKKFLVGLTKTIFIFVFFLCPGFLSNLVAANESLVHREWKVDGVTREALVYIPAKAKTNSAPVVFAFHGHGGFMDNAAKAFHIETLWPEAIVVYMQGLNTPGRLTDLEGKKPGWQFAVGNQNDRDLKFFDEVLASLKKDYKVDQKRIFSTGHSNGGSFTYLLWEARGKVFAAFAPMATISISLVSSSKDGTVALTTNNTANTVFIPRPVLHVAGENDPLVKFSWQKLMISAVRKLNQCDEGKPWETDPRCTLYKSKINGDVLTYINPGTHNFPEEAPPIIVNFFKQYPQPGEKKVDPKP